ncbi:MAG: succinate dehydrogenase, cytochrome b556 subunit [Dehalococcoidia bacterium]|nr:succinate dehydrogenase, cytochrome b556 subunit [Dehalococcoidia bacterium]
MRQIRPRQNYLGVGGWVWAGNYKLERYLYILHRVTGLGILLFLLVHLIVTTFFRIQGQEVWEKAMTVLNNPLFKTGEYLVVVAFVYHALNGLRLLLQELGLLMAKPIPPIYPYSDSLRKKRPWTMAIIGIIIILCLVFFYDFMVGGW